MVCIIQESTFGERSVFDELVIRIYSFNTVAARFVFIGGDATPDSVYGGFEFQIVLILLDEVIVVFILQFDKTAGI